jgi:hypothetical protein
MRFSKSFFFLCSSCLFFTIAGAQSTKTVSQVHLNTDSLKRELAKQKKVTAKKFSKVQLRYMIINASDGTFGYYIFADGQMLIEQKSIPGVSGNKGFVSKEEAQRTAGFVIKKIKSGEMPPTVSVKELKKLNITANFPKE